MKKRKIKTEIILMNMFPNAKYLNNEINLGHEIINLFCADGNKFYLWLNADGTYDTKSHTLPKTILILTKTGIKGLYQIISKAEVENIFCKANLIGENCANKRRIAQLNKVKYANKYLENYFVKNINIKTNKRESNTLITFKCKKIVRTRENYYIAFKNYEGAIGKNIFHLKNIKQFSEQLRICNIPANDRKIIKKIINSKKIWNIFPIKPFNPEKYASSYESDNLIKIAEIYEQELLYSNVIMNILKRYDLTNEFISYLTKTKCNTANFEATREKNNVDLLFISRKTRKIIIIENKIKSGINICDKPSKISYNMNRIIKKFNDVYASKISQSYIKSLLNKYIKNGCCFSQLEKYYVIAICYAKHCGWSDKQIMKNIYCYFLVPEWRRYQYPIDKNGFLNNPKLFLSSKYKLMTYKDIYLFFNKYKFGGKRGSLYKEFLNLLKIHTKSRYNPIEEKQKKLFYERYIGK